MKTRAVLLLIALGLVALGLWSMSRRGGPARKPDVPIQDGKTIDFSSGKPVVKDDPAGKAAIAQGVAAMDAAAANVTFSPPAASPPPPASSPAPAKR